MFFFGRLHFLFLSSANSARDAVQVGEFQCYDPYALASLLQAATACGHPEWGNGGPHDSGTYNDSPEVRLAPHD